MSALIVAVALVGYAFLGGAVGWLVHQHRCKDCQKCASRRHRHDPFNAALAGLVWPVVVPVVAGMIVTARFANAEAHRTAKASRQQLAHERKIAELEAQQNLVREQRAKTLTDIAFLTENGIKAEVPGLYDEETGA